MPKTTRIRIASWPLRAVSLLTLVALLVAPGCAPLCASQDCRRTDASATTKGNCHGAGATHREAALIHGFRNCNLPELPAVVLTRKPLGDSSGESRLRAARGKFFAVNQENSAPAGPLFDFYLCRSHDFSSRFAPVPSGFLPICAVLPHKITASPP